MSRHTPAIQRLKALLLDQVPTGSRVSDSGNNFHCSDDCAVAADLFVRTPGGDRLAVTQGVSNPIVLAVWFGYDLAEEVWCVDEETGQVEQFGKSTGLRLHGPHDELHSLAVPGLVVPVGAVFQP